jgi:hypothetical protein
VLVWPSLESSPVDAGRVHQERVEQVLEVIAKGAADRMWSTFWEVDYSLKWDPARGAWVTADGFAYDGARLGEYARQGGGA